LKSVLLTERINYGPRGSKNQLLSSYLSLGHLNVTLAAVTITLLIAVAVACLAPSLLSSPSLARHPSCHCHCQCSCFCCHGPLCCPPPLLPSSLPLPPSPWPSVLPATFISIAIALAALALAFIIARQPLNCCPRAADAATALPTTATLLLRCRCCAANAATMLLLRCYHYRRAAIAAASAPTAAAAVLPQDRILSNVIAREHRCDKKTTTRKSIPSSTKTQPYSPS
jgi:hypothetical protein